MTNIWPRRAWAAAATLTIAAFASNANAAFQTLVGVDHVGFTWAPSTGGPTGYIVMRSLNGNPLEPYAVTFGNQIDIPVDTGDRIAIAVKATGGYDSAGNFRVSAQSSTSDLVSIAAVPSLRADGSLLLGCSDCGSIARRSLADASVVEDQSTALPFPWVVLGAGALLSNRDAIVWHNPNTGELAVWDATTLAPIPGPTGMASKLLRGIGSADLDRNGVDEFFVQRTDSLTVSAWGVTSSGLRRVAQVGGPAGAQLGAVGDFDRDGRVDLIWQDPIAGTLSLASLTSVPVLGPLVTALTTLVPRALVTGIPSTARVASTGDYDGDGWADLLLRYADGGLAILYLNRGTPKSFAWLPNASDDANRLVIGSGEMDGDSGYEIVLRHQTTGEISILDPKQARRFVLLSAGSDWKAFGIVGS